MLDNEQAELRHINSSLSVPNIASSLGTSTPMSNAMEVNQDAASSLAAIEDLDKRKAEVEELLYIPWVKKLKAYSTVICNWYDVEYDRIGKIEPATKRWIALSKLYKHEDQRLFSLTQRSKLSRAIRELERDKEVSRAKHAQSSLQTIVRLDTSYRKRKKMNYKNTMKLKKKYQDFIKKYDGTFSAMSANELMEQLPNWVRR